jgi:hypothetical protein
MKAQVNINTGALIFALFLPWFLIIFSCSQYNSVKKSTPDGRLMFDIVPDDAIIKIDDNIVGTGEMLKNKTLRIKKGKHRVKIERNGFFSRWFEINISEIKKKIKVELRKIPEPVCP